MSVKISQLPAATLPLAGTELVPMVQAGVTSQSPVSSLSATGLVNSGVDISAVDSGAVNAYVLTTAKPVGTLASGQIFTFEPLHPNTGASTLRVNGGTVLNLLDGQGNALTGGELAGPSLIQFNGTQYNLIWNLPLFNKRTPAEITAGVTPVNYIYPPGDVRRYGADPTGAANSSPAFTSAFAVKGLVTAVGNFLLNTAVTMDISTTSLVGPGELTSGLTAAGTMFTVSDSGSPETNTYHKIDSIAFVGQNVAGVIGVGFGPGTGTGVCNFKVNSCTFTEFVDAAVINNNAFEIQFDGCSFSQSGSLHAALYVPSASSERVSCVQCEFFNNTECLRVDGGGEVFLDNCSLDYSNRLVNAISGNVYMTNCYVENGSTVGDLDYWFKTAANGSTILWQGGQLSQTASKTAFAIGQSSSTYGGGIFFRNVKLFSSGTNGIVNPLIAGSGFAFASGCLLDGFSNNNFAWANFSAAQNLCSNGTFINGGAGVAFAGWTVEQTGGSAPTTASNTMLFQVAAGGDSLGAYWTVAAQPGDNIGATLQMKGNVTTAQFSLQIRAVGADGVTISTTPIQPTFNAFNGTTSPCPTAFTQVRAIMFNCPAGTATCQIDLNTLGATSNANIVTMQNVQIGKY